jgi:hypothetical protein
MNNVLKAKKEIMKKQDNAVYSIVEKKLRNNNKNFFILLFLNIVLTISSIELIKKVNFDIITIPYVCMLLIFLLSGICLWLQCKTKKENDEYLFSQDFLGFIYHDHIDSIYNANLEKEALKFMKKEDADKIRWARQDDDYF